MTIIVTVIGIIAFAIAGPIIGCFLAGLDRIISARMQGRVGPPLLQPYYDVRKLFSKENASVNIEKERGRPKTPRYTRENWNATPPRRFITI